MAKLAIPRYDVHRLAEACADAGDAYRGVATRLIREQKPLANFLQKNLPEMDAASGEVSLYMFSVILRIFEQYGGRMNKVAGSKARSVSQRISAVVEQLVPFDDGFVERVRAIEWRAQPHVLDEVMWALYERDDDDKKDGEVDVDPEQAALIFLVLWACVEALDETWRPPRDMEARIEASKVAEAAEAESGEE